MYVLPLVAKWSEPIVPTVWEEYYTNNEIALRIMIMVGIVLLLITTIVIIKLKFKKKNNRNETFRNNKAE